MEAPSISQVVPERDGDLDKRWSPRQTLAFVLISSTVLWSALAATFWALI